MDMIIHASKHLSIELVPGTDNSDPALRLFTRSDPDHSFIVFLSEVHLLRDALATAGTRLAEIEAMARKRRG